VTGYPRAARNGNQLVLAWNESSGDESQRVKAAVVQMR
jgi:hypothetical protein